MAIVTTDNKYYAEIADAIRAVNGLADRYTPAQMAAAILALKGSELPDGYTLLEYIQSTGTQYIDTGFKPNQATQAVVDAEFIGIGSAYYILGSRVAWQNAMFAVYAESNGTQFTFGHGTQTGKAGATVISRHIFDLNKNSLYIDDALGVTLTENNFQGANSIYLFSCNHNGSPLNYTEFLRIYSCQIYDNGTLVRDYVPCINPDGEVGLYDEVGKQFYGNAGTGVFVAGYKLPDGYTLLEYIESSGTQYIDTGFVPNQDTRVACEFEYTTAGYVFGAENAYRSNSFDFYTRLAVYNATSTVFTALSTSAKHSVDFNKNVVSVDGSTKVTFTYASFSSGLPLFLFAVNSGGNGIEGVIGKIYSCQIYNNGTMVRDYVPCRKNDGVVGMYDFITNKFYKNAGTGSFVAGAEVI